jgi:hypothetical protein
MHIKMGYRQSSPRAPAQPHGADLSRQCKILRIVNHGFRWMFYEFDGPVIFDPIPMDRMLNLFRVLRGSVVKRRSPASFSGNE